MSYSIYEYISIDEPFLVNAFVTSIQSSTFHWHNEYELLGILRGAVEVKVRSESVILKKGDLLLINPNVFHAIKCMEGEDNLCMIIQMHLDLFQEEKDSGFDIRFYLDSTSDEIPACGFRYFFCRMAKVIKARDLLKNTNKNMNYILDVCGFGSEKTFYRVFKQETGMTPNEFRKRGQVEHYNDTLKDYLNFDEMEAKEILNEVIREAMVSWKKERLQYNETAKKILERLSLEEKISLLSGNALQEDVRNAIQKKRSIHYNEVPYRAGGEKIPVSRFQL